MSDKTTNTNIATVTSEQIFAGRQSITIVHAGSAYTLRITKQNKLILTK
jgi:hemin uptake protein HemP